MKTLVIDASVAAKLLFTEPGTDAAEAVLRLPKSRFIAPDLLPVELGSLIWKRYRRGEVQRERADAIFQRVNDLPIDLTPIPDLLDAAFELAMSTDRTIYDCLYIAAAISEDGVVITADERLVNGLARGPLASRVSLLAEFA